MAAKYFSNSFLIYKGLCFEWLSLDAEERKDISSTKNLVMFVSFFPAVHIAVLKIDTKSTYVKFLYLAESKLLSFQ